MSDINSQISTWCDEQLEFWKPRAGGFEDLFATQQSLCSADPTISILLVQGRSVIISHLNKNAPSAIISRTALYQKFISELLQDIGPIQDRIALCLDVSDEPSDRPHIPVFSFQKHAEFKNILLPDVDFFYFDFYQSPEYFDLLPYADKTRSAVFVGSTTGGGEVSREKIAAGQVPRVDAGMFFSGNPLVDFRLPRLVQVDGQETEQWLRQKGFGVGEMSWGEQFQHRFILSMDGNGAACSRLFIGLRSKSAVIKYSSSSRLFYHNSLIPGTHFVPVEGNSDVLNVLEQEQEDCSRFEYIAQQSTDFCNRFLCKQVLQRYTHSLLSRYSSLFKGVEGQISTPVNLRSWPDAVNSSRLIRSRAITNTIPDHLGMDYRLLIRNIHQWLTPQTYLEVGVEKGETFTLSDCKSIGVDVAFQFSSVELLQKISGRPMSALYRMPSDGFFKGFDPAKIFGSPVELAFLDGMHQCEYLLRDFINTEKSCRPNSIIMLHDCCPLEVPMTAREPGQHAIEAHREGWWTGDVWRTALALKRFRKDLRMVTFDAAPTGLVCITNLDPNSTSLHDDYFTVVDEMRSWDLADIGLGALLLELEIMSTDLVATAEQMRAVLT